MKKILVFLMFWSGFATANSNVDNDLLILNAKSSSADYAHVTFYDPDVNNAMEGGPCTNRGSLIHKRGKALGCTSNEYLNSVEDAINNHRPVSIAADDKGAFGKSCNSVPRRGHADVRCTVLVFMQGFDELYPKYHKSFPHLPKNTFIGLIEDTGGDFHFTKGHRFDIAVRSHALARSAPGFVRSEVHWTKLENPCGTGAKARTCEFDEAHLAPTVLAMLNLKEEN